MNLMEILKRSVDVLKKNPIIAVPPLAAGFLTSVLAAIVVGGSIAAGSMAGRMEHGDVASLAVGAGLAAMVVAVFGGILWLLSNGMTVSMAREALDGGKPSIGSGLQSLMNRIVDFLIAGIVTGIAVGVGSMFLVLPGIIAMFFLMFSYPAIVVEGQTGIGSLKRSAGLVKERMGESLTLFAAMAGISIGVMVVNMILGMIPLLGQLAALVLWGAFGGYASLVLVAAFRALSTAPGAVPRPAPTAPLHPTRPAQPVEPPPPPPPPPPPAEG